MSIPLFFFASKDGKCSFLISSLFCNTFPQSGISLIALRGAILLAFSCHGQQRPASHFHSYQHPETLFLFTKVLLFSGGGGGGGGEVPFPTTVSHFCTVPLEGLQILSKLFTLVGTQVEQGTLSGDPSRTEYLDPFPTVSTGFPSRGPPPHRQERPHHKGLFMP